MEFTHKKKTPHKTSSEINSREQNYLTSPVLRDAGRQRKEEISEQIYLFGGNAFDFPAEQEHQQELPAGERLGSACQCLHSHNRVKQLLLRLQGATETFSFPDPGGQQSSKKEGSRALCSSLICDMKGHEVSAGLRS